MNTWLPLNSDNYDEAFELQCRCHSHPWSRATFIDCLSAPYFAYACRKNDETLGYYLGLKVLDEVTLMDIGTAPDYRGRGIGRMLLEHFVIQSQQQGARDLWLEVRASNDKAIHLYFSNGFELIERRKGYYPCSTNGKEDALIMKRVVMVD